MANQPAFIQKQYDFAAHIRHPQKNPCPDDVEPRRMKIYADLFYNNVEDFISSSFPVLRSIHDDASWHHLVRDYFHRHRAKTPLFPEMPREFLTYLENERPSSEPDYPFMLELAHYEWTELALSLSDRQADWTNIDPDGDLLTGRPVLSPLAWPLSYHWPVHQIGPDFLPDSPAENMTYLLIYRDQNDEIRFMELNPVTARLLQLIMEPSINTVETMLHQIARELAHPEPALVVQAGLTILQDLVKRQIILGIDNT